jgi:two-component system nitrogen regulation response regulator GlnG
MQQLYKSIGRVAAQDVTVLLLGESGTGKELVARTIYEHSKRSHSPYLAVNCAALTESLLESELFGHEQGAFTGADRRRVGKFEQVHGGTIFLDEVGDMSPATQAKVLRLLQGGEFERVGGRETVRADVRIIAATNRDLESMVTAGTFRRDLYYRLNGLTISLPPLRERLEDIPLLVEHFVTQLNRKLERHIETIAPEVLQLLASYDWPGNVRELENVVRYALIHARGNVVTLASLPQMLATAAGLATSVGSDSLNLVPYVRDRLQSGTGDLYRVVLAEVDRILLREVLAHVGGNQVHASQLLGISRSTLRSKLGLNRLSDTLDAREGIEAGNGAEESP